MSQHSDKIKMFVETYGSNKSILYVGNRTPPSACTSTVADFFGFRNYIAKYGCPPSIIADNIDVPFELLLEWLIDKDQHLSIIPKHFNCDFTLLPESQGNICRCMLDKYLTSKALA